MKFSSGLFALAVWPASAQTLPPSGSSTPSSAPTGSRLPSASLYPSIPPSDSPSDVPSLAPSLTPSSSPTIALTASPLPPTSDSIEDYVFASTDLDTFDFLIRFNGFTLLNDATEELTVFAPSDDAFAAYSAQNTEYFLILFQAGWQRHRECLILSHIVDGIFTKNMFTGPKPLTSREGFVLSGNIAGSTISIDGGLATSTNVPATNGVVHIIDKVIEAPCVGESIFAQAAKVPALSQLVARVTTAGLVTTLSRLRATTSIATRPLTVLAPTNAAWNALSTSVRNYLATNVTALTQVLTYHVVPGMNFFVNGTTGSYTTLQGQIFSVAMRGGSLTILGTNKIVPGQINFTSTNNLAQNGVFHIIDQVLFPPGLILPIFVICFPGEATVQVKDMGTILMKNLKIGDEVLTSSGTYDKVYSFGHYQPEAIGEYLKISTKETKTPLLISKDHMVFVNSANSVAAGSLKVGDEIFLSSGNVTFVSKIETVYSMGAYAPFTESGSVVVDGVVASSYIGMDEKHNVLTLGDGLELPISYQWMAHASQAPHRLYCRFAGDCAKESYTADGVSQWVHVPYIAGRRLLEQNILFQVLGFIITVPVFVMFHVAEIVMSSPLIITSVVGLYSVSNMCKLRFTTRK